MSGRSAVADAAAAACTRIFSGRKAIVPLASVAGGAVADRRKPCCEQRRRSQRSTGDLAQRRGDQTKLSSNLGVPVAAPRSSTSLQLSLENEQLASEQRAYIAALEAKGTASDDVVGFVFAINGRINSADIYPSNGLFRKMWPKLLRRSVTEAIGERGRAADPPPATAAATEFITKAQAAPVLEANTGEKARTAVRQSATTMAIEARPAAAPADAWIHRSVLAK